MIRFSIRALGGVDPPEENWVFHRGTTLHICLGRLIHLAFGMSFSGFEALHLQLRRLIGNVL
jgi:hypothetical protein